MANIGSSVIRFSSSPSIKLSQILHVPAISSNLSSVHKLATNNISFLYLTHITSLYRIESRGRFFSKDSIKMVYTNFLCLPFQLRLLTNLWLVPALQLESGIVGWGIHPLLFFKNLPKIFHYLVLLHFSFLNTADLPKCTTYHFLYLKLLFYTIGTHS